LDERPIRGFGLERVPRDNVSQVGHISPAALSYIVTGSMEKKMSSQ